MRKKDYEFKDKYFLKKVRKMYYFVELCRKFMRLEPLIYKAFCDIMGMYKKCTKGK